MNKASRKLNAILLVCLMYMLYTTASASIMLTAQPDSSILSVGGTTNVSVQVSGLETNVAPSLGTFDLDVVFDPAVLDYVGALFGGVTPMGDQLDLSGLGSLSGASFIAPGTVNFYEVSLDEALTLNAQQSDSFTLVTLYFQALNAGTSQIAINVNALGDADGAALSAETQGTAITVTAVPLGNSAYLFTLGLACLLGLGLNRRAIEVSNSLEIYL